MPEKSSENPLRRVQSAAFHKINEYREWWELPLPMALLNITAFREDLRKFNLYDTEEPVEDGGAAVEAPKYRTYDGARTDPNNPRMGQTGTRFGRNIPIEAAWPEEQTMLDPSPREVSENLLNRDSFKPATTLNVLAAAWLQFQNHDWFSHGDNSEDDFLDVPLRDDDPWPEHPMKVRRTSPDSTNSGGKLPPTYINKVTPWWDASQIYGSTEEQNRTMRTGEDGKMRIEDGRLPEDPELQGLDLTGFNDNYHVMLSMLHTLFTKEHNAICEMLKKAYPSWDDEKLFLTARLVNAALIAKIHTVEWTPGILANQALQIGMHANWYGVLPKWITKTFGHVGRGEVLSGIVGSPLDHHSAPYSITSEFVSVYRMHPLIPDDYQIRNHETGEVIGETDFTPIQGRGTREWLDKHSFEDWFYTIGTAHPGAITLHNHPNALRNLTRLSGEKVDIATIDVLRDRERGVPRYNDFREKLRKKRIERFEDLTPNPEWNRQIREVYSGDIDKVDNQVGLLGEALPTGFGFSDTAFRIFILMASRRLKSDRFFTDDYTPEVYTPEGLEWIDENLMGNVIVRHHPTLARALEGSKNTFAPWPGVKPR